MVVTKADLQKFIIENTPKSSPLRQDLVKAVVTGKTTNPYTAPAPKPSGGSGGGGGSPAPIIQDPIVSQSQTSIEEPAQPTGPAPASLLLKPSNNLVNQAINKTITEIEGRRQAGKIYSRDPYQSLRSELFETREKLAKQRETVLSAPDDTLFETKEGPVSKEYALSQISKAELSISESERTTQLREQEGYRVKRTDSGSWEFYKTEKDIERELVAGKVSDLKAAMTGSGSQRVAGLGVWATTGLLSWEDPLGIKSTGQVLLGDVEGAIEAKARASIDLDAALEAGIPTYALKVATGPFATVGAAFAIGSGIKAAGAYAIGRLMPAVGYGFASGAVGVTQAAIGTTFGVIAAKDIVETYERDPALGLAKAATFGAILYAGYKGSQSTSADKWFNKGLDKYVLKTPGAQKDVLLSDFLNRPASNKLSLVKEGWEKTRIPKLLERSKIPETISDFKTRSYYQNTMSTPKNILFRRYTPEIIKTYFSKSSPKSIQSALGRIRFSKASDIYAEDTGYYGNELYPTALKQGLVKDVGLYDVTEIKTPYAGYSNKWLWTRPENIAIMPHSSETSSYIFMTSKGPRFVSIANDKSFYSTGQITPIKGGDTSVVQGKFTYKSYETNQGPLGTIPSENTKGFYGISKFEEIPVKSNAPEDLIFSKATSSYRVGDIPTTKALTIYEPNKPWSFDNRVFGETQLTYSVSATKSIGGEIRIPGKYGLLTVKRPKLDFTYTLGETPGSGFSKDVALTLYPSPDKTPISIFGIESTTPRPTTDNFIIGGGGLSELLKTQYPRWSPPYPKTSFVNPSLSYLESLEEGIITTPKTQGLIAKTPETIPLITTTELINLSDKTGTLTGSKEDTLLKPETFDISILDTRKDTAISTITDQKNMYLSENLTQTLGDLTNLKQDLLTETQYIQELDTTHITPTENIFDNNFFKENNPITNLTEYGFFDEPFRLFTPGFLKTGIYLSKGTDQSLGFLFKKQRSRKFKVGDLFKEFGSFGGF